MWPKFSMKRARSHDPGFMNFAISVGGLMEIVTVNLVSLSLIWKWRIFFFQRTNSFSLYGPIGPALGLNPSFRGHEFHTLTLGRGFHGHNNNAFNFYLSKTFLNVIFC